MNIDCRVIGDLLPLYADESCSDASRALVDDHLKTCPRCRETLARMKSEQFLPAAQAIDPPAVADYAQKVKHRRQKRGTLLTVGVIALIVLLSLTAAAWMNLVRAQHPYIPVVEESVCNLAAGEVQTFADSCDGRRIHESFLRRTLLCPLRRSFRRRDSLRRTPDGPLGELSRSAPHPLPALTVKTRRS